MRQRESERQRERERDRETERYGPKKKISKRVGPERGGQMKLGHDGEADSRTRYIRQLHHVLLSNKYVLFVLSKQTQNVVMS